MRVYGIHMDTDANVLKHSHARINVYGDAVYLSHTREKDYDFMYV